MGWLSKSIFRRLLFSYLVTVLLGLGVAGLLMSFFAREYIYESKEEELLRKAKRVNLAIQHTPVMNDKTVELLAFLDQSFDTRIWVFDRNGQILATSMKDEVFIGKSVASSIVERVTQGQNAVTELRFEGLNDPMLSVVVPWGVGDQIYGGIVLHAPIEGIEHTFSQMRETILWATLFGILLSTAMVSYLSWSISRPLQRIERAAAEIGMGRYEKRVEVDSHDEIGDLAATINRMAEKLEMVEQERRHLEQVRNDFLANVSHELRTPLTAMQGFLEALQDGLVTDEAARRRYYQVLYQESMHMNRLVEDLMELMKLESNEVTLSRYPVNAVDMLQKTALVFRPEAEEKGTAIETVAPAEPVPPVLADPDRLTQILNNLVKNAVKFTENGTITLSAQPDGPYVKLTVSDTGIGIPECDIDRIWERFFKADRGRSRKNKGAGLGLAIVKELVTLHDGRIAVESRPGEGTSFFVWLPAAEQAVRQAATAQETGQNDKSARVSDGSTPFFS